MLKAIQLPIAINNYFIAYYQTLYEATCLLRQEKINKAQMFWINLKKIANFIQKSPKSKG